MSLRSQDSKAEQVVAEYLDRYFYPLHFPDYNRATTKEIQLLGIDTIVRLKGQEIIIDEKSAIHYVNKNLPTFAFEINFRLQNGNLVEGWFLDEKKKTEYYLLCWITATKPKYFNAEDITNIEVILIDRRKLIDEIGKCGLTKNDIVAKSEYIRKNNIEGVSNKDGNTPFYFYLTTHLSENPLNLIIKKLFLSKHSILHLNIKPK